MQGFTWNIDKAQAYFLYRLLHEQVPQIHRMYDGLASHLMEQCELYLALNPYRRADGQPIPLDTRPLLPYSSAQARVGVPGDH